MRSTILLWNYCLQKSKIEVINPPTSLSDPYKLNLHVHMYTEVSFRIHNKTSILIDRRHVLVDS